MMQFALQQRSLRLLTAINLYKKGYMSLAPSIKVLLIVASNGYQPEEFGHTKKILEDAGITVVIASDAPGTATVIPSLHNPHYTSEQHNATRVPQFASCQVAITLDNVNPLAYDGITIVGGAGALEHLDNAIMHTIITQAHHAHKVIAAICIAPRILAHAGILHGKQATGWNADNALDGIYAQHGVTYIKKSVVMDGTLITADGPRAAKEFGNAIAQTLLQRLQK